MYLLLEGLVTLEDVTEICTSANVTVSACPLFAYGFEWRGGQTEDGQSF